MTTVTDVARWSKDHRAWGQRRRVQRNHYAYLVLMAMTGGLLYCPACANPLDLDTAEVDRAIPSLDYRPGNIVYLCSGCNQGRSKLQSIGKDWRHIDGYIRDIALASRGIPIPSEAESMAWWATRPTAPTVSRYA